MTSTNTSVIGLLSLFFFSLFFPPFPTDKSSSMVLDSIPPKVRFSCFFAPFVRPPREPSERLPPSPKRNIKPSSGKHSYEAHETFMGSGIHSSSWRVSATHFVVLIIGCETGPATVAWNILPSLSFLMVVGTRQPEREILCNCCTSTIWEKKLQRMRKAGFIAS